MYFVLFGSFAEIEERDLAIALKLHTKEHIPSVRRLPTGVVLLLLAVVLSVGIVLSTGTGFLEIAFADVLRILLAKLANAPGLTAHLDDLASVVVMDVRLPRILTAALVGGGLAISGAVFQGILLNPLADPYTLGGFSRGRLRCLIGAAVECNISGTVGPFRPLPSAEPRPRSLVVIYLTASSGRPLVGESDPFRDHRRRNPVGRGQLHQIHGRMNRSTSSFSG